MVSLEHTSLVSLLGSCMAKTASVDLVTMPYICTYVCACCYWTDTGFTMGPLVCAAIPFLVNQVHSYLVVWQSAGGPFF